ncbi:glycoside hydrolase family 108 protein [Vibrio mediterranei]
MFDTSFDRVVLHEGGYQCDPKDRGNWTGGRVGKGELKGTNFGIAAMTYPNLDIKNLTIDQVRAIYFEDWWVALGMDRWRPAMQYQLFDAAVNHGFYRTAKLLQRTAGAKTDGVIGPKTLASVRAIELNDLLMRFMAKRIDFYTRIATFNEYGRGWMRRMAQNLLFAALDN